MIEQDNIENKDRNEANLTNKASPEFQKENSEIDKTSFDAENQKQVSALEAEIKQLRANLQDKNNDYLRVLAESDNMRKRSFKEKQDIIKYGIEHFCKDLLPTLDSFEQAVAEIEKNQLGQTPLAGGILLVARQITELLAKYGVQPVRAKGEKFNPNIHQAIKLLENMEVTEDTVHEEFNKGYVLHDRLLRPAMVSVHVPKKD